MAGRWFVVSVDSPSDETTPFLAEGFVASGAGGVEERGRTLVTWLPEPADPEAEAERLRHELEAIAGAPLTLRWEWREERDWLHEWRRGLGPRRVGSRLVVTPSWSAYVPAPADLVLVIDPGIAFGTGEHASTRGCLRLLEPAVRPGARVLDVGTGSAVLAIAAARLGAAHVDAVDSDPVALAAARENVERNGVADRVALAVETASPATLRARTAGSYDLITANILSSVIVPLLPAFVELLAMGGAVVMGGILRSEAAEVRAAVDAAGLVLEAEDEEEAWWSGRAIRSAAGAERA